MACNTDYLEPTQRERELMRAASLLVHVLKKLDRAPEEWMLAEAKNIYARDDRSVTELCAVLKSLEPEALDRIVYDARDRTARDLANWWEDHRAADATRERREREERQRAKHQRSGIDKLSAEERKALGLEKIKP